MRRIAGRAQGAVCCCRGAAWFPPLGTPDPRQPRPPPSHLPAGLTGLLLALGSQQRVALAPIVGLREVNPYVASAVDDWRSRHALTAALPRQQAPMAAAAPAPAAAGSSSFGMSGVNAHMLLVPAAAAGGAPAESGTAAPLAWQRQHYWPAPAPHPLLLHCTLAAAANSSSPGKTAHFAASFAGAGAAVLRDHRVGGRLLVPATAFFELLLAAAGTARDDGMQQLLAPSLAAAAIQAPKILGQQAAAEADAATITLQLGSGAAEVASTDGTVHVRCSVATLPVAPLVPGSASPQPAVLAVLVGTRAASAAPPARRFNFARLDGGSGVAAGSGWRAHPSPTDAALHLSAVRVAGLTDEASRVPVAVAAVAASAPATAGACSQQWAASELPTAAADGSALCSIRARLAGGAAFTAASLHAKPLPGGGKKAAAVDAAAEAKAFEQRNFTYQVEWQAAGAAALAPAGGANQAVIAHGGGLRLRADAAAATAAAASGDLSAALAAASQLSLQPAGGKSANGAALAGRGIELLQRVLAAGGAPAVQALTSSEGGSPAAAKAGTGSAILAALLKVAAVENPAQQWAALAADGQAPQPLRAALGLAGAGADQHGARATAGALCRPQMQRHAM